MNKCKTCQTQIPDVVHAGKRRAFCSERCKMYHINHIRHFTRLPEALVDMEYCLALGVNGLIMWAEEYARDTKGAPRRKVLEEKFGSATGLTPITSLIKSAIDNHPDNDKLSAFGDKFNAWANQSTREICPVCMVKYPSFNKTSRCWRVYCSEDCCNTAKRSGGAVRETIDEVMIQAYGVKGGFTKERLEQFADEREERTGFRSSTQNPLVVQKALETRKRNGNDKMSKAEIEIKEFIESLGLKCEHGNWSILTGKQLDLYVPEKKLAIEYNGCFFHSEGNGGEEFARCRHVDKTNACEDKGIQLLHIWEDQWHNKRDVVLKMIKAKLGVREKVIYARQTTVVVGVDPTELYESVHIQGFGRGSVVLGLVHDEVLVAAMSFIRRPQEGVWELNRYAGYNVVGGFTKLLRAFQRSHTWTRIISFGDRCVVYRNRNLYTQNGFTEVRVNKPDYMYTSGQKDRIHKFNFRKKILAKKYGFPLSMTEHEMALEAGFKRIYNSGLIHYELTK